MGKIQIPGSGGGGGNRQIFNVMITITDNTAVAEGQAVTAVCNNKTASSIIKNGQAKIYTSEVGTYTITAGSYSTMLVCPYFGQFSTDIYSGTLKITCTETEGNNKTCHVRSCDANYVFTNSYDLTQTFDGTQILTFLGIPVGNYIITVNGKYRFYKEITSIQFINNIEVELKQWLYKGGDQCQWNTGGWISGLINQSSDTRYAAFHYDGWLHVYTGEASANAMVNFLGESIHIVCNCYGKGIGATKYGVTPNEYLFCRGGFTMNAHICTKNKVKDIKKFSTFHVTGANGQVISFRTGAASNSTTTINTTTILAKGTGNEFPLSSVTEDSYLVLGNSYSLAGTGSTTPPTSNNGVNSILSTVSYNNNADITEIYLI